MSAPPAPAPQQLRWYNSARYYIECFELGDGPAANAYHKWLNYRYNEVQWARMRAEMAWRNRCEEELIDTTVLRLHAAAQEKRAQKGKEKGKAGTGGGPKGKAKVTGRKAGKSQMSKAVQRTPDKLKREAEEEAEANMAQRKPRRRRLAAYVEVPSLATVRATEGVRIKGEESVVDTHVRKSARTRKMTVIAREIARTAKTKAPARRVPSPLIPSPPQMSQETNTMNTRPATPALEALPDQTTGTPSQTPVTSKRRGTGFGTFLTGLGLEHTIPAFAKCGLSTKEDVRLLKRWPNDTKKAVFEWILKKEVVTPKDMGILYEHVRLRTG